MQIDYCVHEGEIEVIKDLPNPFISYVRENYRQALNKKGMETFIEMYSELRAYYLVWNKEHTLEELEEICLQIK